MPNSYNEEYLAHPTVDLPTNFTASSQDTLTRDGTSPADDLWYPDDDPTPEDPFAFLDLPLDEQGPTADQTDYSDPLGPIDRGITSQGAAFDLGLLDEEDANEASASPVRGGAYESDSTSTWRSEAPAPASGTLFTPNPRDLPFLMPTSTLESDTGYRNQLRETLKSFTELSGLDTAAIEEMIRGIVELNSNNQLPTISDQFQPGDDVKGSLRLPTRDAAIPDNTARSHIRKSPSNQSTTPSTGTKRS